MEFHLEKTPLKTLALRPKSFPIYEELCLDFYYSPAILFETTCWFVRVLAGSTFYVHLCKFQGQDLERKFPLLKTGLKFSF